MATLKLVYNNGKSVYLLRKHQQQIDFLVDVIKKFDPSSYHILPLHDGSFQINPSDTFSAEDVLYRILLLSSCYENSIADKNQEPLS